MDFNANAADSRKSTDRLNIMPIGDSRTAGNGSVSMGGYKLSLFRLLTGRLGYAPRFVGSNMVAPCVLPNCATSGHTSAQILTAVTTQSPLFPTTNVYLLDSGTNDVLAGTPTATTTANVLSTIAQIRADNPSATIFLASAYDVDTYTAALVTYNAALLTAVQGIASYSASPVLGKTMWYDQYAHIGPYSVTYWGDDRHLNVAGYALAATGWYNQIITLF